MYEEFVKEFAGDDAQPAGSQGPRGSRPFVSGGVVRPGQGPAAANPALPGAGAEPSTRKPGGRYVPSFMPPGMAAAMDKK